MNATKLHLEYLRSIRIETLLIYQQRRLTEFCRVARRGYQQAGIGSKKLNKSYNWISGSIDTLHLQNPNLNTIYNSKDALELTSAKDSCNISGGQTDHKSFHSKRGGSDNPAKLHKQINMLNQVIQKKDVQISFLKKT